METPLIVVAVIIFAIGWAVGRSLAVVSERMQVEELLRYQQVEAERQARDLERYRVQSEQAFQKLVAQAKEFSSQLESGMLKGRQWLADAFAEFVDTRNLEVECWLAVKPQPALKSAMLVAAVRKKARETVQRLKLLEYQVKSYEEYFPFLVEYRDAILDEAVDLRGEGLERLEQADPAISHGYLSSDEYDRLSTVEKFQLALDRYWARQKSQWHIGRVYERYVGYLYERDGWRVTYQGILKGFEDFGRDLLCVKGNRVLVVQCKCWSREKVIHEKHIFQLFGTSLLLRLCPSAQTVERHVSEVVRRSNSEVMAVFATTTGLSPDATAVAKHLGVVIRNLPLVRYPMIKCNINPSSKEKIYHLPFDQQYDKVVIGDVPGECYVETIADAEAAGFRRAFRWRGGEAETKG